MDYPSQLRALDERRDSIRALASDQYLQDELERAKASFPESIEKCKNAVERRASRRQMEKDLHMNPVPPGPWDEDLDMYHDKKGYTFDIGDGYSGRLTRNMGMSWNGYVILPKDHPALEKNYDWFRYDSPKMIPSPPMELTYGDNTSFGFDHLHSCDIIPLRMYRTHTNDNYYTGESISDKRKYLTFEDVKKEVIELANYFKEIGEMTGYPPTSPKIRAPFQEPVPKSPLSSPKVVPQSQVHKNPPPTIPKNSKVSWAQVVSKKE